VIRFTSGKVASLFGLVLPTGLRQLGGSRYVRRPDWQPSVFTAIATTT